MLHQLFKYFNLSRTEQNGFFVLCTLILFLFSFPYIINFFNKTDYDSYNIQAFTSLEKDAMATAMSQKQHAFSGESGKIKDAAANEKIEKQLFAFDPNTLDEKGWRKLGLTEKQVKVVLNYRDKGGKFYKKEDLAKIYSISLAEFKRLENFIEIAPTAAQKIYSDKFVKRAKDSNNDQTKRNKFTVVDINDADTTAFITLRGIGSVFSKRIVKYRESLGGFVALHQIKEVYGLPQETFDAILPNLKINPNAAVSKLAINELDEKSLSKHPYINFKQSKAIVNYRHQHGNFQNLADLEKVILLDDEFLRKLAPYLTF